MERWRRRAGLALAVLGLSFVLGACASRGAAALAPPPAGSPLAAVARAMDGATVRDLLGPPGSEREYQTWRAWSPFHFEAGTSRTDWHYAGQGRVVFARNRYSGRLAVIEVVYEPGADD